MAQRKRNRSGGNVKVRNTPLKGDLIERRYAPDVPKKISKPDLPLVRTLMSIMDEMDEDYYGKYLGEEG